MQRSSIAPELWPTTSGIFKENILHVRELLQSNLPDSGLQDTDEHLQKISKVIIHNTAPTFFGLVTGGVTPVAAKADKLVTDIDANVAVHLPEISIATDVEDTSLRWILELCHLDATQWTHKILTTGATSSNILGLACGRDWIVQQEARKQGLQHVSVAHDGLYGALQALGKTGIQILTTLPHSSLRKAASIVGIGRNAVLDVIDEEVSPRFNLTLLEEYLKKGDKLNIVVISCGEVNTGRFATTFKSIQQIKTLCDKYNAWLHVDAAFGLLARALPSDQYSLLTEGVAGLELADSITGDAHKLFNVPYDCGIFFSRHPSIATEVFQNPNAAYLSPAGAQGSIISPLNAGLENSRRFRALPLYASLRAYGRQGFQDMLQRQIATARLIAKWIADHNDYDLLPEERLSLQDDTVTSSRPNPMEDIYMIVLFRAKHEALNEQLVEQLNASQKLWVSGTVWDGRKAARIAVANWQVDPARESQTVIQVLYSIAISHK